MSRVALSIASDTALSFGPAAASKCFAANIARFSSTMSPTMSSTADATQAPMVLLKPLFASSISCTAASRRCCRRPSCLDIHSSTESSRCRS